MQNERRSSPTPIALVGVGKIARDQHIPAIATSPDFFLAATVTRNDGLEGVPDFPTIEAMMRAMPDVRAVSICTPPRGRLELVRAAFAHNLDVMLEKPPAGTLSEAEAVVSLADASAQVLHVTWHSRMAAAVTPAKAWLSGRTIVGARITWKENVRVWHPGQEWIWEPGIGVFDPGINALSVLTELIPGGFTVEKAKLWFPSNKPAPIAADLMIAGPGNEPIEVSFDFDEAGPQIWNIEIFTTQDVLLLSHGASRLSVNGNPLVVPGLPEYFSLYARFNTLIAQRTSDIDLAPFRLVADAFLIGERETVAPFRWDG